LALISVVAPLLAVPPHDLRRGRWPTDCCAHATPPSVRRVSLNTGSRSVALRCVALRCVALRCVALRCVEQGAYIWCCRHQAGVEAWALPFA
jgi:hypothetical protein